MGTSAFSSKPKVNGWRRWLQLLPTKRSCDCNCRSYSQHHNKLGTSEFSSKSLVNDWRRTKVALAEVAAAWWFLLWQVGHLYRILLTDCEIVTGDPLYIEIAIKSLVNDWRRTKMALAEAAAAWWFLLWQVGHFYWILITDYVIATLDPVYKNWVHLNFLSNHWPTIEEGDFS